MNLKWKDNHMTLKEAITKIELESKRSEEMEEKFKSNEYLTQYYQGKYHAYSNVLELLGLIKEEK